MSSKYENVSKRILDLVGGRENIDGAAHCATRLRLVLHDYSLVEINEIEALDLVKGAFKTGDQLQIIIGAGTVNSVYQSFVKVADLEDMSIQEVKRKSAEKQNPLQRTIKALSDVFVQIIPGLLAAALLMGITGLLSQPGVFGERAVIEMFPYLAGINRFIQILSTGIFTILPLLVVYSATRRFGGNPVLGLVLGAIMLHPDLGNAYAVASGSVEPEIISMFGFPVELVGFQGGIIVALMMGFVVAKLDQYFNNVVPDLIKLFLSPLLTVTVSGLLLFVIVGPIGRMLASGLTSSLMWSVDHLGVVGFVIFAGVQQLLVITGLHHVIGAVEAQLLADTGLNFIMPLMSVALMGQGGAVLGFLFLRWRDDQAKQIGLSAFASLLFGISEPALFGVTLRYKFPLIAGCIASMFGGAYVYYLNINALGFGATAIPGLAIVATEGGGHLHYIIANLIPVILGALFTISYAKVKKPHFETKQEAA